MPGLSFSQSLPPILEESGSSYDSRRRGDQSRELAARGTDHYQSKQYRSDRYQAGEFERSSDRYKDRSDHHHHHGDYDSRYSGGDQSNK